MKCRNKANRHSDCIVRVVNIFITLLFCFLFSLETLCDVAGDDGAGESPVKNHCIFVNDLQYTTTQLQSMTEADFRERIVEDGFDFAILDGETYSKERQPIEGRDYTVTFQYGSYAALQKQGGNCTVTAKPNADSSYSATIHVNIIKEQKPAVIAEEKPITPEPNSEPEQKQEEKKEPPEEQKPDASPKEKGKASLPKTKDASFGKKVAGIASTAEAIVSLLLGMMILSDIKVLHWYKLLKRKL